jgi:hypothetical protein
MGITSVTATSTKVLVVNGTVQVMCSVFYCSIHALRVVGSRDNDAVRLFYVRYVEGSSVSTSLPVIYYYYYLSPIYAYFKTDAP